MARVFGSADELAASIVRTAGKDIVLGLPIGIGKATHIADALFETAASDPSVTLTIFTGLTLEPPEGAGELEKRFLEPFVGRLYPDWPVPKYAAALRDGSLPPNVRVREFYLRPGAYLGNRYVQQQYSNINYSEVAGELVRAGVNVLAQLVAVSPERPGRYSLACNPEVTLDLLPHFAARREAGLPALLVGQVNRHMPYMLGDADLDAAEFDCLLDDESVDFPLFPLPNRRVADGDYAAAMHVASLVRDGGTIQLGIGSLSDAVAHCLALRHASPAVFGEVLRRLPGGTATERRGRLPIERSPFDEGLYASTELLGDALFSLFDAGLVRRPADDAAGTVMHAGFFIGSNALYEGLRSLPVERRRLIDMTAISNVNTLFGDEFRKRAQRRDARFINETMMVTLLGAAVSDALEDGRVVSGVGGQFDFVSMAQALDGAMSILMCRARREGRGTATSNVRWDYGHTTVPRHHRDVFVTEYGIAATRGCGDRDLIDRMLHIADAGFQDELVDAARRAGKLESGYTMADDAAGNTPAAIASVFDEYREHFPPYPLGTEFTAQEQALAEALGWLRKRTATARQKTVTALRAATARNRTEHAPMLVRMGLEQPSCLRQRVLQRLLAYALQRTGQ
ncbi:MAG: acetyl-CoA hydrolase [Proteobacteria bacterium]|nr:acetyl-CoA hydrolase [Pseudomonadota bacterium]